jgi:hypothetical protein
VSCFADHETSADNNPARELAQIAAFFSEPADALTLKRDRLTALIGGENRSDLDQSWATIYFLFHAPEALAFSQVRVDFGFHTEFLWQCKRADLLALLGHLPDNAHANDFIAALAVVLKPEEIPILWHEQPAALPRIIAILPSLATTAAAWNMSTAGQHYLWESLRAATIHSHCWGLICGAMLEAQCAFAEREAVALAGSYLTEGLMNWLKTDKIQLPSLAWREALGDPLARALEETALPPSLLALAVWTLSPEQASSLSGHRSDVQAIARLGIDDVPAPLVLPVLFWLTILGFKTPGEDGFRLLACAFFRVYDAVALSDYPREAWERLDAALPDSHGWWDWDRCLRLRRALQRWLLDNPSFADAMSQAAPTAEYTQLVQRLSVN